MKFYVKDGMMRSDINSASEINVSHRLFSILQDVIHTTNDAKIFYLPDCTTKSDGEPTYDCVATSLAQWGNYPYSVIQNWITEQFGNKGVPVKELNRTVQHFYPNAFGSNPNNYIVPGVNWDASMTVGVFSVGNGFGHMSNIVGKIDTNFIFRDGADTSEYVIPLSQVSYIYYNLPMIDTLIANVSVDVLRRSLAN